MRPEIGDGGRNYVGDGGGFRAMALGVKLDIKLGMELGMGLGLKLYMRLGIGLGMGMWIWLKIKAGHVRPNVFPNNIIMFSLIIK